MICAHHHIRSLGYVDVKHRCICIFLCTTSASDGSSYSLECFAIQLCPGEELTSSLKWKVHNTCRREYRKISRWQRRRDLFQLDRPIVAVNAHHHHCHQGESYTPLWSADEVAWRLVIANFRQVSLYGKLGGLWTVLLRSRTATCESRN